MIVTDTLVYTEKLEALKKFGVRRTNRKIKFTYKKERTPATATQLWRSNKNRKTRKRTKVIQKFTHLTHESFNDKERRRIPNFEDQKISHESTRKFPPILILVSCSIPSHFLYISL
jgi:hypothetical protein